MGKKFNITGIIFLSIFLIISIGVITENEWVSTFDRILIEVIQSQVTEGGAAVINVLTDIGGVSETTTVTIIITVILLFRRMYAAGIWFGLTVLLSAGMLVSMMKSAIGRERPDIMVIATEQSMSFPSGHTTAATVFYGMLGLILILILKKLWAKIVIGVIASLIILFVMLSRIYLGVHFPTDVLGGLSFGLAVIFISVSVYHSALPRIQRLLLKYNLNDKSPSLIK